MSSQEDLQRKNDTLEDLSQRLVTKTCCNELPHSLDTKTCREDSYGVLVAQTCFDLQMHTARTCREERILLKTCPEDLLPILVSKAFSEDLLQRLVTKT